MSDGFNRWDPFREIPDLSPEDRSLLFQDKKRRPAEPNFRAVQTRAVPVGPDSDLRMTKTTYDGQIHAMRIPTVAAHAGTIRVSNIGHDVLMKIRRQALGMKPHVHSAYCVSKKCRFVATIRRTVRFLIGRETKDGLLA